MSRPDTAPGHSGDHSQVVPTVRSFSSMYAARQPWLQKYAGDPQSSAQSLTQTGSWSKTSQPQ
ncbi:hypothetical protein BRC67_01350 [Halobacteriales archaeon QH_3_68_24]|nr:MAG: hypothetical protein BRC67_01350 [Halobacteriales archaeon QH_3_68_24]